MTSWTISLSCSDVRVLWLCKCQWPLIECRTLVIILFNIATLFNSKTFTPSKCWLGYLCSIPKMMKYFFLLHQNLQCGESVTIEGQTYTISAVTHRYQLRKGKYEPSEKRLDVQSTGRYILNLYLESLLEQSWCFVFCTFL